MLATSITSTEKVPDTCWQGPETCGGDMRYVGRDMRHVGRYQSLIGREHETCWQGHETCWQGHKTCCLMSPVLKTEHVLVLRTPLEFFSSSGNKTNNHSS